MTQYTYNGTTSQKGLGHFNRIVALKIDIGGVPEVSVIAETAALMDGTFSLEWADWSGRVIIGAVDDEGTIEKLDCVFHDAQTGEPLGLVYSEIMASLSPTWYYDFSDGTVVGTTVTDLSGNGNNATLLNATPTIISPEDAGAKGRLAGLPSKVYHNVVANGDGLVLPNTNFYSSGTTGEYTMLMWFRMSGYVAGSGGPTGYDLQVTGMPTLRIEFYSNSPNNSNGFRVTSSDASVISFFGNTFNFHGRTLCLFAFRYKNNVVKDIWVNGVLCDQAVAGNAANRTGSNPPLPHVFGRDVFNSVSYNLQVTNMAMIPYYIPDQKIVDLWTVGADIQPEYLIPNIARFSEIYNSGADGIYPVVYSHKYFRVHSIYPRNATSYVTASNTGVRIGDIPLSGKCYWEVVLEWDVGSSNGHIGISVANSTRSITSGTRFSLRNSNGASSGGFDSSGFTKSPNMPTSPGRVLPNEVTMHAYDADTGQYWAGKNGVWYTGDPSTGVDPVGTLITPTPLYAALNVGTDNEQYKIFTGQEAYNYTPPSGFGNIPT